MPETLVAPAYRTCPAYSKTFGPEVVDLAASFGLDLDGNQALCLDDMFSVRPGTAADPNLIEDATVCDRQNLKTVLLEAAATAKLALFGDDLVVWTAHEYPTSVEAFRDIKPWFTDYDHMSRLVRQVYEGKGDESIELMSGARMIFRARTKHGGRGISGDTVILDEAQKLTAANMGALVPTISARQRSQLFYGGTAGDITAHVWRRIRDRGRAGGQARLGYREWCAPQVECGQPGCLHIDTEGCALDRMDLIHLANPSLGLPGRLREEVILTERQTLPPAEFMRERMGWWEDPPQGGGIIGLDVWDALAIPSPPLPEHGMVYALEVPVDRESAAVGIAWLHDGKPHLEVARVDSGTGWVLDWLKKPRKNHAGHAGTVVVDESSPAVTFVPDLERVGITVVKVHGKERAQACGSFFDVATTGGLTHNGDPALSDALTAAVWKTSVEGARTFSRKTSGADISRLYAVTLALHALSTERPSIYEERGLVEL